MYKENKNAINYGVIIGVISILMLILVYYLAPQLLGEFSFGIATMLISLVLYIVFILKMKKEAGEYWPFKTALKAIFIMALVSTLVTTVFNYVFYNFIEPNAYEKVNVFVTESLENTYSKFGMSQDDIDSLIEQTSESMKSQFKPTLVDSFRNVMIACIMQFVLALIFAAIFKKNQPIIIEIDEDQIR